PHTADRASGHSGAGGLCASDARAHGGPTSDQLTSPLKEFLRVQNLLRETMYPLPFR
ncbi:hypothetical protein CLOSS21_00005, partial [Clostridium sp. SS2/1]